VAITIPFCRDSATPRASREYTTWQRIKLQEALNMFTMEISVHSDKHSIAI